MNGLRTLLALELQALWSRRLWRWGMAVTIAIALVSGMLASVPDSDAASVVDNGWNTLLGGFGPALLFAGLVALLLGSQLIAAEAGDGSLRSTLMRPVSRRALVVAKLAALVAGVATLWLGALLTAGMVGAVTGEFGDVTVVIMNTEMVKQSAGTMAARAAWPALLTFLALLAAGAIGLTVSSFSESGGAAATGAMFGGVPLVMASTLTFGWTEWLFPRPCLRVWASYSELAGGFDTATWHNAPIAWSLTCSAGWVVVAVVASAVAFQRRDLLS